MKQVISRLASACQSAKEKAQQRRLQAAEGEARRNIRQRLKAAAQKAAILSAGGDLKAFRCKVGDCNAAYESMCALQKHIRKRHRACLRRHPGCVS